MSFIENQGAIVAQGVQAWLENEAFISSHNPNSPLDELEPMRQELIDGKDPKFNGHASRMELWLAQYDGWIGPEQSQTLVASVAFGALIFLSGAFRRQRYMQSIDQNDYDRRKQQFLHPYGIIIPSFLPECLEDDRLSFTSADTVKNQGAKAIETTRQAFDTIYAHVPADFGKDISISVEAIIHEQEEWLSFLSKVLTHSSGAFRFPMEKLTIFKPNVLNERVKTTLEQSLAEREQASAN
jgi:hypothetical protein